MSRSANRIDHAAEAKRLIELASIQPDTDSARAVSDAAQVHATLALVEQQRIANLLRLHAEYGHTETALFVPVGSASMALRPDIAAALGIATTP